MTTHRTDTQERQRRAARRPRLISLGVALALAVGAATEAGAAVYRVETSTIALTPAIGREVASALTKFVKIAGGTGQGLCVRPSI